MPTNQVETSHISTEQQNDIKASIKRSFSQRLTREKLHSNKLYRTPPTPTIDEFFEMEKSFVLDGIAISNISNDYLKANPQLGSAIPPYNSLKDKSVSSFMKYNGLEDLLKKTGQYENPESIAGKLNDMFHNEGLGFQYLDARNKHGNGHSREVIEGHRRYMGENMRVMMSYNNMFGYRRNIPKLRCEPPSNFHVDPRWYEQMRKHYLPHFKNEDELFDHFRKSHIIGYPFHDNNSTNFHPNIRYVITVKVSDKSQDFFQGNLRINLISKNSDTGQINLDANLAKGASKSHSRKLFKRGQTDIFEFNDHDIRTVTAIILSKDTDVENALFIDYVQLDLHRSHETQSILFPFDGWLCSAKQDHKSEELKAKFGLESSILTYPNEKPKYEYTIKMTPSITKTTEYKIEIDYDIKPIDKIIEYDVEFLSDLPQDGRLTLKLFGSLGQSKPFSFTNKSKPLNKNKKLIFRINNNEIGVLKYALLNYDDCSRNKEYYLKGIKISDEINGLNYNFEVDELLKPHKDKIFKLRDLKQSSKEKDISLQGMIYMKLMGKSESTDLFHLKCNEDSKNGTFLMSVKNETNIGNIQNLKLKFEGSIDLFCEIKNLKITSNKGHEFKLGKILSLKHNQEVLGKGRSNYRKPSIEGVSVKQNICIKIIGEKRKSDLFKLKDASSSHEDSSNVDLFYKSSFDLGKIKNVFIKYGEQSNKINDSKIDIDCIEIVDPRGHSYKFIGDLSLSYGESCVLPKKESERADKNEESLKSKTNTKDESVSKRTEQLQKVNSKNQGNNDLFEKDKKSSNEDE